MFATLYKRLIVEPIAFADRFQEEPSPGPRSAQFKTITAFVTVSVLLCFMNFFVLDGNFQGRTVQRLYDWMATLQPGTFRSFLEAIAPLFRNIAWSLGCLTLYFVIPALIVKLVYREKLSDYGLSPRGFFRHLPIYLVLFAPVLVSVIVVSYSQQFQDTYPFYHHPKALWELAVWEFFYCLQFFALEFFFRGFMIHSAKHRMGSMAVWAMVIPYCMIHFQKPFAEALAAIVAGAVLGVLSLRTGTLWGGVFIHSAVAISMDWSSLIQRGVNLLSGDPP